jgi:hypothetical protein
VGGEGRGDLWEEVKKQKKAGKPRRNRRAPSAIPDVAIVLEF